MTVFKRQACAKYQVKACSFKLDARYPNISCVLFNVKFIVCSFIILCVVIFLFTLFVVFSVFLFKINKLVFV